MYYVWITVGILFAFLEMGSPGLFFFLSFSGAAFLTAFTSFVVSSVIMTSECVTSLVLFLVYSIIFLVLCKRIVEKRASFSHKERTNVFALQGKQGVVVQPISSNTSGYVKIDGEKWFAKTDENVVIPIGALVDVLRVQGAHVFVRRTLHKT